jgi:hypothetical protein
MYPFGFVFPAILGINHLAMSAWSPFYNAFNFVQKCEWLAWTNTVIFQSSFSVAYLVYNASANTLGKYFLSYVLYDTVFLSFYNRSLLMYIHHALAIGVLWLLDSLGLNDHAPPAVIYLESSNILLGVTWLLNRAGYGKTTFTKVIGAIALAIYIINRAVLFPNHLLFVAPRQILLYMSPFLPMNYYWCWKLVEYYTYIAFGMKLGG